jgi:hypothetical protein
MREGFVEHRSARSSRGRREERDVTAARRSDSAGEDSAAVMSAWAEERSEGSRWEGRDGNEAMEEAATSGSGKERSQQREERVEDVGRQRERAEEVEREALADGGGGRGEDLVGDGAGERGDVAARGALLQRQQQRGRLPQRVRGAQVGGDLRDEEVHRAAASPAIAGAGEEGGSLDLRKTGDKDRWAVIVLGELFGSSVRRLVVVTGRVVSVE